MFRIFQKTFRPSRNDRLSRLFSARGNFTIATEKIGGRALPVPRVYFVRHTLPQPKQLLSSGLFDWQRNEPRRFRGLHPQQDGVLARGTRVTESLADFGGI